MEPEGTDESVSVDSLFSMFGDVVSRDVIITVVESCGGDFTQSLDAIMRITNDNSSTEQSSQKTKSENSSNKNQPTLENYKPNEIVISQKPETASHASARTTYARAFRNTGTIPKQRIEPCLSNLNDPRGWNNQCRMVVDYHNKGYRTMILLRGVPGSGKTFLAHRIIEMTIGVETDKKKYIFSADDFFMVQGRYCFNKLQLQEAHERNIIKAKIAMEQGVSPVIIDNTNIEIWEMEPYARIGVSNGYFIEIIEPNTPWARKANQLYQRNVHSVPINSIRRMLDKYESNITGTSLLQKLKLHYPSEKVPPIIRSTPVFQIKQQNEAIVIAQEKLSAFSIMDPVVTDADNVTMTTENSDTPSTLPDKEGDEDQLFLTHSHRDTEIEKQFEEFAKVEQEWDNGENWVDEENQPDNRINIKENVNSEKPQPQRQNIQSVDKLQNIVNNSKEWNQISIFMPPWENVTPSTSVTNALEKSTVTMSNSTCIEIGDMDDKSIFKVITATPRDINEFYMSLDKEKIPDVRKLDKSSMTTNEDFITDSPIRCKSEEKHFKEFRKLFKNLSKNSLRDIFDQCLGDVNWAVEIVLDGMASKQLKTVDESEISDEETNQVDGEIDQCTCLAAYSIVPDRCPESGRVHEEPNTTVANENDSILQPQKKIKKDINVTGDTLIIKRLIEQNVGFSDNHYSEHCLKIRKFRRGENNVCEERVADKASIVEENSADVPSAPEVGFQDTASSLPDNERVDDEESIHSLDDIEKTVNAYVGKEFIAALDGLFGRKNMTYPEKVLPKINIPISMLNEINALWMESLMYQLDEHDKQTAIMFQEDEDFARKLAQKEAEIALSGNEPEVPDFKEIMDMDFALSLYQKDVAEWRNREPNDLAAKLTRDKLYNLFPDVDKDTLSELLMAHDNNFQSTVEVLLMSTGKDHILKEKNGLNKYVMEKEMERQGKILEKERQVQASNRNDRSTLDLHYLRVGEAKEALDLFIDTHIQRLRDNPGRGPRAINLYFITGRGLHSNGKPKIKPAVKRRLYERGLIPSERNPGLLTARVCAGDKMSFQVS